MSEETSKKPWEELQRLASAGQVEELLNALESLPSSEAAWAISRMTEEAQAGMLSVLDPRIAADWIERLEDAQAAGVMEELEPADAAAILHELASNDRADLLHELDRIDAEAILAEMEPAEATSTRSLAAFSPDVAGGLMVTEYLSFGADSSTEEVVEDLRRHAEIYADYQVQYVYVIEGDGALSGVLRLRDLLLSRTDARLRDLMIQEPVSVSCDASLDEVRDLFEERELLGVPVVDHDSVLVGLLRRVDVHEALAKRAGSDYRKAQGIVGGEELRSMPTLVRSRRRLSWLSVNIVLNVLAASVIAFYEETLAAVIALAAFLPIISDMSGCSGNQAVAVSMRELSLGLVKPGELRRTWLKEVSIGALNGLALGLLLGFVAWLWKGNLWLGLVVGGALSLNTLVAVSIGGVVPLALRQMGLDPALASGPILTTVTDLCGFLFALSLATLLLPKLIA